MRHFAAAVAVAAALLLLALPALANHGSVVVTPGFVNERDGRVRITLTRCRTEPGTLAWDVRSGTAIAGRDFDATKGSRVLDENEQKVSFDLVIKQDDDVEKEESIDLHITNSSPEAAGPVNEYGWGWYDSQDCVIPGPRGAAIHKLYLEDDDAQVGTTPTDRTTDERGTAAESTADEDEDAEARSNGSASNGSAGADGFGTRAENVDRAPTAVGAELVANEPLDAARFGWPRAVVAVGAGAAAIALGGIAFTKVRRGSP